jgi:RNA polymerase sigma factor (sigma-70 family)
MVDVVGTPPEPGAPPTTPKARQVPSPRARSSSFDGILAAAQAGAGWAFSAIWTEYAPAVAAFARARGSREPDDLASDVFLALFEHLPGFVGNESQLRSFLFSIAYRRLVDEHRRRGRRGETDQWSEELDERQSPSAEDEAIEQLGGESTLSLLDELPTDQRNVMMLRIFGDLTIEQIAEIVGKREGAVKALQRRALESLRKKVSPNRTPAG